MYQVTIDNGPTVKVTQTVNFMHGSYGLIPAVIGKVSTTGVTQLGLMCIADGAIVPHGDGETDIPWDDTAANPDGLTAGTWMP